ncbi:adenosylmethionine--8-amino-7-oxononanoate transaminase [Marmoricola sp. RAF53]|uniref:adenosylmethionine--8-amino-7-oxononanoate transaminase n=1 Tax=Marmoricola sp. RAF53 TaxID=3233059 RepID=UPI003F989009
MTDLLTFDRDHLWHPYSSMTAPSPVYPVLSASGTRLRLDRDGREVEVVDAMSSWWCAIHGYAVPELDAAVRKQLDAMSHVMFGGLTHEPAVELGRRLVRLAPEGLDKVFFADSGSVSVEVAMKMAWQAHAADGLTRTKMFTIRGGYHGDTFSPMSVTDPEGGMHSMYGGLLIEHVFADRPPRRGEPLDDWKASTTALFEQHADEIAAVVVEPLLQGAGGMHVYDPEAVQHLAALARAHGALLIFDEIATGFWRTGPLWAGTGHAGVTPDILCVGKALTGGYLTLAAVITSAEVAARVDASPARAMMHGPTFMANPLACAVASASLDLLESRGAADDVRIVGDLLRTGLSPAVGHRAVADVRTIGAVGVLELWEPVDVARVTAAALDRGVWVRPFRNLVYTMPPYVSTAEDVATITAAMIGAVDEVHG